MRRMPDSHGPKLTRSVAVVCEKPFTPTYKEAEELVALAEKQGKLLAVYQSKTHPPPPPETR